MIFYLESKASIKNDKNKKYTVIAKSLQHSMIIAQNNKYCRQSFAWMALDQNPSLSIGHKQAIIPTGSPMRLERIIFQPLVLILIIASAPYHVTKYLFILVSMDV